MGFWDSFTDLIEAATPWSTVEAEAVPRGGTGSEKTPADKDDGGEGEAEVSSNLYSSKINSRLRFDGSLVFRSFALAALRGNDYRADLLLMLSVEI